MSWAFSLEFSVAIFLLVLTERFGGVTDFVYSDVSFVKPLLSRLRFYEGLLLIPSTDYCRSYKTLERYPSVKSYWYIIS